MVAQALSERYREQGHESRWLASDVPAIGSSETNTRVKAWNILEDRLGVPYPLWSWDSVATTRELVDWAEVIHCHDCLYLGTVLAVNAARREKKPVLLTQHVGPVPYSSAVLRSVQNIAYATLGRTIHQRADKVVFISRVVADWFAARVSYETDPTFLPNGVDTSIFHYGDSSMRSRSRQGLELQTSERVFLFVGRFVFKKGTHIVRELAQKLPGSRFIMIGEGPIDPREWHLTNVQVLGFQSQESLRKYYWASDALLMPSSGEGFPLVVMEAMACGLPVVLPEETYAAWGQGLSHFVIAKATPEAIADILSPNAPPLPNRESISRYATSQWDWDRVTDEYLNILRQLLSRS